jgi:hypothetical protein
MVTTNRGSATPISAPGENRGVTQTGVASASRAVSACSSPCESASAMPTASAAITA